MSPLSSYLLQTAVTLVAIVVLAFIVIYGARRVGAAPPGGPLELVGRLPLDGRRAIYLVRVGEQVYVIGASEGGLEKLGELSKDALPDTRVAVDGTFAEALRRALGKSSGSGSTDSKEKTSAG